jgi:hypothetical protein
MACLNQTTEEASTQRGALPVGCLWVYPSFILDDDALRRIPAVALLMSRAGINVVMAIDGPIAEQWPRQLYRETEGPDEWVI